MFGMHGPPAYDPPDGLEPLVEEVVDLGAAWYKILDQGNPRNVAMFTYLLSRNVQPIIRVYAKHLPGRNPNLFMMKRFVDAARAVGSKLPILVEGTNEINMPKEYTIAHDRVTYGDVALVNHVSSSVYEGLKELIEMGACPAIPAMAPANRNGHNYQYAGLEWTRGFYAWLKTSGHLSEVQDWAQSGRLWLAVHTASFARPFDFSPYKTNYIDDMCLLGYRPYVDMWREHLDCQPSLVNFV